MLLVPPIQFVLWLLPPPADEAPTLSGARHNKAPLTPEPRSENTGGFG